METDSLWSDLGATINDTVQILNGAVISIDAAAEIEKILLTEGKLRFEAISGIDFKNPALKFKDSIEAGIWVEKGMFGVDLSNPVEGRYICRPEMKISGNSITRPENSWTFGISEGTELREDLEFVRPQFLEFYFVKPRIYYNLGNDLGKIEFEDGLSRVYRRENLGLNQNSLDGGSSSWVDFDRSKEQKWTVEGSLSRYWRGKRKIQVLHHLANTIQRENPVLFVSDELFSYVMIEGVEEEIEGNYYDFKLELQEVMVDIHEGATPEAAARAFVDAHQTEIDELLPDEEDYQ